MIGETVVRVRPGTTTDRYNAEIPDWSEPAVDRLDIDRCAFAPSSSAEDHTGGRQAVLVGVTLYAPAGADITPTDRIEARGETYEVDGDPADWRNPYSGSARGLSIPLRKVTG